MNIFFDYNYVHRPYGLNVVDMQNIASNYVLLYIDVYCKYMCTVTD